MLEFIHSSSSRTLGSQTSMMQDVIARLYKVPGMTNDELRLYVDKASIYIKLKDGSGTLCLFINFLKIHHVYVFDRKNKCQFGGYVGWLNSEQLRKEVDAIKHSNL